MTNSNLTDYPCTVKVTKKQAVLNRKKESQYRNWYFNDPSVIHRSLELIEDHSMTELQKKVYATIINFYIKDILIGTPLDLFALTLKLSSQSVYQVILTLFTMDLLYIKFTKKFEFESIQILKWI